MVIPNNNPKLMKIIKDRLAEKNLSIYRLGIMVGVSANAHLKGYTPQGMYFHKVLEAFDVLDYKLITPTGKRIKTIDEFRDYVRAEAKKTNNYNHFSRLVGLKNLATMHKFCNYLKPRGISAKNALKIAHHLKLEIVET